MLEKELNKILIFLQNNKEVHIMYYDKDGNETEDKKKAWAWEGQYYFIRCSNGRLVNPLDLMSKDSPAGQDWFKVTKKAFDLYLKFLKTKKLLLLKHAQREIL